MQILELTINIEELTKEPEGSFFMEKGGEDNDS